LLFGCGVRAFFFTGMLIWLVVGVDHVEVPHYSTTKNELFQVPVLAALPVFLGQEDK
jgi:hypothetical protein